MRYYTARQLKTLKKFSGKFLDTYPLHYEHWNIQTGQYETVYEVRGISSEIRENYETVEEITS